MLALTGAKTERAAIDRHQEHIQRSLRTVSPSASWYPVHQADGSWVLTTSPVAVELIRGADKVLYLSAIHAFVVEHSRPLGGYKVRTTGYVYSVGASAALPEQAALGWHWHPDMGPEDAHAHVSARDEHLGTTGKWHLPTSRVYFEQVIRFLIVDLDVRPAGPDWEDVLRDIQHRVEAASTWRGARP